LSWHEDDPEIEQQLEDALEVIYLVKHPNGKLYEVTPIDTTDDQGVILAVDPYLVTLGVFPEKHLDSRYIAQMGYKLFIVPRPSGYVH
jgi:hypothetical protein